MYYGLDVHKDFIQVCRLWPDGKRRQDSQISATAQDIVAFGHGGSFGGGQLGDPSGR
ncbi:MAG: hypothetical protein RBT60_12230 [Candidatus Krumholzibacteria bacterium]|jgi:hypothetical protein|nr:hypothetical protein [Candidatus Krumholzibacteria bacterium]